MLKPQPILDPAAHDAIRAIGQAALLSRVVALYLGESPKLIEALRSAVAVNAGEALLRAAHTLKSSSRGLGGIRLSAVCAECESRVRAGRLAEAAQLLDVVQHEYALFEQALAVTGVCAVA